MIRLNSLPFKCFSRTLWTTQAAGDKYTAMSGGPKNLQKMINSELKRMEKQRSKVQAKPKKLNFLDSTKAKTFNRMFQENLSMVMTFDKIKEKLKSHPVHVTRVRVSPNFDQVYISWTTSMSAFAFSQELQKLLDEAAPDIRFEIQQYALMGRIPKLQFVKEFSSGVGQLLILFPENEISIENSLKQLMDACQEITAQEEDNSKVQVDLSEELRTDVLLDREKIMTGVLERLEHSLARHRMPILDDASFTQYP